MTSPPKHLSRTSKAFWRAVLTEFELSAAELQVLQRACEAQDRLDEARKLLDSEGLTVVDRYGQTKPHLAAAIEVQNRIAVARLLRDLRLDSAVAPEPRPRRSTQRRYQQR